MVVVVIGVVLLLLVVEGDSLIGTCQMYGLVMFCRRLTVEVLDQTTSKGSMHYNPFLYSFTIVLVVIKCI